MADCWRSRTAASWKRNTEIPELNGGQLSGNSTNRFGSGFFLQILCDVSIPKTPPLIFEWVRSLVLVSHEEHERSIRTQLRTTPKIQSS